jgi:hypothetical protein
MKFFGLDELAIVDEGVNLEAFVGSSRIPDVEVRLGIGNLLDRNE